jgi:hypothetical protein
MPNKFNTKANRTNLHLSAQCRQQIEEIREAAVSAGQLKPTVAAVIGEAVQVLYAAKISLTSKKGSIK